MIIKIKILLLILVTICTTATAQEVVPETIVVNIHTKYLKEVIFAYADYDPNESGTLNKSSSIRTVVVTKDSKVYFSEPFDSEDTELTRFLGNWMKPYSGEYRMVTDGFGRIFVKPSLWWYEDDQVKEHQLLYEDEFGKQYKRVSPKDAPSSLKNSCKCIDITHQMFHAQKHNLEIVTYDLENNDWDKLVRTLDREELSLATDEVRLQKYIDNGYSDTSIFYQVFPTLITAFLLSFIPVIVIVLIVIILLYLRAATWR
jgi:hypothetical protein